MKMVIKEIDEQGRVVIPYDWRREEGLRSRGRIEMIIEGGRIVIKPLKYKTLMETKSKQKGIADLESMEKAEFAAAVRRHKRASR